MASRQMKFGLKESLPPLSSRAERNGPPGGRFRAVEGPLNRGGRTTVWLFYALCVLCLPVLHAVARDREAFSITNYDLNLQIDSEQHRLGVRGNITLRNDTTTPQKI